MNKTEKAIRNAIKILEEALAPPKNKHTGIKDKVYDALLQHKELSASKIASITNLSTKQVSNALFQLSSDEVIYMDRFKEWKVL